LVVSVKIMQVIPAIDLRGGHCVRLRQGDFEQETVFGDDPTAMAARWESEGAERIHLVDLDGAKTGRPVNVEAVRRIVAKVQIPCQLGGGLRDQATIAAWLDAGLDCVVVGTQALRDPDWFGRMAETYPDRLILGLDARDGRVATEGWADISNVQALALAHQFDSLPLAAMIYTDIARDGTLSGPNLDGIAALAQAVQTPVIASGGVGGLDDLERLAALPIAGCVIGRALYDGRFTLGDAIRRGGAPSDRRVPSRP
jgi:phosphoribosylformimino-5-aminoimidazole carboxamide ribotide isomerase